MGGVQLLAYRIGDPDCEIVPASPRRIWADDTWGRFAYHCLPLTMASSAGWLILSPQAIVAVWTGGLGPEAVKVWLADGPGPLIAHGHFGAGTLTWNFPYLLRTPPGWDLLIRGPANHGKHGIVPLEGLVETDWNPATATMNWRFTAPGSVAWMPGDPIAMVVPQSRAQLDGWEPEIHDLEEEPELATTYRAWSASRDAFNARSDRRPSDVEGDYKRGVVHGVDAPTTHRQRIRLPAFVDRRA